MNIWKVKVKHFAINGYWTTTSYTGVAGRAETAVKLTLRAAKRDGLIKAYVQCVKRVGDLDFDARRSGSSAKPEKS